MFAMAAMALTAATPQLDAQIERLCIARGADRVTACAAEQKAEALRFVRISDSIGDPRRKLEYLCARRAQARAGLDWVKAASCLSGEIAGRYRPLETNPYGRGQAPTGLAPIIPGIPQPLRPY